MKTSPAPRTIARAVPAALALLAPFVALAALQDRGPAAASTGYPAWYRDGEGTALELCLAQTPSPNASAGGAPMCFPWSPDPLGYPNNLGEEQFYLSAGAIVDGAPGVSGRLDLALEAAYVNGTPVRGDEMVFARVRVVLDVTVPGTYRVVHPYGVEEFPDVVPGPRAVAFTEDIGIGAGLFDAALDGRVGPFLRWDVLDVDPASGRPYQLTVDGPDGREEYLGDPNVEHTITGSPYGTNFFRVEGPPGSNLDGQGNDFLETPLFSLVGKKHLAPIPTRLEVTRASYSHDGNVIQVDVFATTRPGARLVVSAVDMPTTALVEEGAGRYFARVVWAANGRPAPAQVVVTNLSDVPTSMTAAPLHDTVTLWTASYDPATGLLDVAAYSSDQSTVGGPELRVMGVGGGAMSAQSGNSALRTAVIPLAAPPAGVTVVSAAGGVRTDRVKIAAAAPVDPAELPVAVADEAVGREDTAMAIPVLVNDLPGAGTVILLGTPAVGGAVVNPETMTLDYTPKANWSGTDVVSYLVQDPAGLLSNATTVTISVLPVNDPPATAIENVTTNRDAARTIAVLANDRDLDGAIVPASLAIAAPPSFGAAAVNPDGTVTYTPAPAFAGTDSFGYTVQDDQGATSAVTTVTVTVLGVAEQLTPDKVQYEVAKQRWVVVGTSSVFGPNINNSVTFHNGPSADYPVIGSANIDETGRFQWQPAPGTVAAPHATNRLTIKSTGGGQLTATVVRK